MGNASIEITKKTPELSGTLGSLFYTKKEMITCRIIISFFLVHEYQLESDDNKQFYSRQQIKFYLLIIF